MTFEEWLAAYSGPVMAVGGSVLVALISAYAAVRARRTREPVAVDKIWDENAKARREADDERALNIFLERKVARLGLTFLLLWAYTKRLVASWGEPQMPRMRRDDQAEIDKVLADLEELDTPPNGPIRNT